MRTPLLASLAVALLLCGCSKKTNTPPTAETSRAAVAISAWIRLAARPDLPASGYFDATTERKVGRLTSVAAPNARIEMHQSMTSNHMSSMKPIGAPGFEQGKIVFAPGGKHLMIYGLDPALKAGATLPLTFTFEGLPPIIVDAQLVGPGDPAPGSGG